MTSRLALALVLAATAGPAVAVEWNTPESRQRWAELSEAVFGSGVQIEKTDRLVTIDAPATAHDAALVPVTVDVAPESGSADVSLIIDQNPSPVAAKVRFGTAGDARQMTFRVRVDGITNIHAVVRRADGALVQSAAFVKGAGGCSTPIGTSEAEAVARMGEMKMKFGVNASLGDAPQATLMIRHPNFNGMQMDQMKRAYTPARFITSISVARGKEQVFAMASDISLSTDPVLDFLYAPGRTAPFRVTVVDSSGATWTQQFDAPAAMN